MEFVRNGPEKEFVAGLYSSSSFDWYPEERFLAYPIDHFDGYTLWYNPGLQVIAGQPKQPSGTVSFYRGLPDQNGFLKIDISVDSAYKEFTTVWSEVTEIVPSEHDLCQSPERGTALDEIPDEEQTQLSKTTLLETGELADMETVRQLFREALEEFERRYGVGNWERD